MADLENNQTVPNPETGSTGDGLGEGNLIEGFGQNYHIPPSGRLNDLIIPFEGTGRVYPKPGAESLKDLTIPHENTGRSGRNHRNRSSGLNPKTQTGYPGDGAE